MRLLKNAAALAIPLVTIAGCSSSQNSSTEAASASSSATRAVSTSSAANPPPSKSTSTSSTISPSAPSTSVPASKHALASSTTASRPSPRSNKAAPQAKEPSGAKTADCTNLGTGHHYACTQQEYDAINEADEPDVARSTSTLPTASACGDWERRVRLTDMLIMCGDGGEGLTNIHWSSWTPQGATGTGTHFERVCEPDCAQGHEITTPVRIQLSGPVQTPSGPEFSTMTVTGQRVHTVALVTGR